MFARGRGNENPESEEHEMAKKKTEKTVPPTLAKAVELGGSAKFIGWTKLPHEPIMAGRFDDGTVIYRSNGKAWAFGKTA
jgi:hypothetical protein